MNSTSGMAEAFDRHLAATLRGEEPEWPLTMSSEVERDLDALWARVQFHGIAGLLAERIGALREWPEALCALVREEALVQAFWEESHRAMLVGLLAGLADCSVSPLLMKGSALAYSLYAEPSSRRRGDTDLLIRKPDLTITRSVLRENGFTRRDDPHGLFYQETWLADTGIGLVHAVDLHWQPSDSPALQNVLRVDEFFARNQPLPRLSVNAAMPCIVLTFLQGALNQAWHGAKGYFVGDERLAGNGRLIWAWDNHLLAGQFSEAEWIELAELTVSRGIAPICLAALELAQFTCSTAVPADILQKLRASQNDTRLVHYIADTDRISMFVTDLKAIQTQRAKLTFLLGHALPDSGHLRRKYPKAEHWPVALLHLRRMGESALRLARLG